MARLAPAVSPVLLTLCWTVTASAQLASPTPPTVAQPAAADRLDEALDRKLAIDIDDLTLPRAAEWFAERLGVPVRLDAPALEYLTGQTVSLKVPPIPARSAIALMFEVRDLPCRAIPLDCAIVFTTDDVASGRLVERRYDAARLPLVSEPVVHSAFAEGIQMPNDTSDALGDVIQVGSIGRWEELDGDGGWFEVELAQHVLSVHQTHAAHRQIEQLLADLRRCLFVPAAAEPLTSRLRDLEAERALEKPVQCLFSGQPLREVFHNLARQAGVPIVILEEKLKEEGIELDERVDCALPRLPLHEALELIRIKHGFPFKCVPRHDVLVVTTEADAQEGRDVRVYDVTDLARIRDSRYLFEVVQNHTGGPPEGPWQEIDGEGACNHFVSSGGRAALVIDQTYVAHREIAQLLADLRRVSFPAENVALVETRVPHPELARALEWPVRCVYSDAPLHEVVNDLARQVNHPIVILQAELAQEGVKTDTPISFHAAGLTLGGAVPLIAESHGLPLTCLAKNGALLIGTEPFYQSSPDTRVYDVSDLIIGDDFGPLIEIIQNHTGGPPDGPWQEIDGEGGTIGEYAYHGRGALIICQTDGVHREIADLFREDRRLRAAQPPPPASPVSQVVQKLRDFRIHQVPLDQFLDTLRRELPVPLIVMRAGFEQVGLKLDQPVTLEVGRLPLGDGLNLLFELNDLPISWVEEHGALVISPKSYADGARTVRVWNVTDLLDQRHEASFLDFGYLIEAIQNQTSGPPDAPWQEIDGEGGTIGAFDVPGASLLAIRQTRPALDDADLLIQAIRRFRNDPRLAACDVSPAVNQPVWEALRRPADWSFRDVPLRDLCPQLSVQLGVPVRISPEALKQTPQFTLSYQVAATPAATAIPELCRHNKILLQPVVRHGAVELIWEKSPPLSTRLFRVTGTVSESLVDRLMHDITLPNSPWQEIDGEGGSASVIELPGLNVLAVRQTPEALQQVEVLLKKRR